MKVVDAIMKRRSVRAFQSREVPQDVIDTLLACAVKAPTGGNRQPWFFYIVRDAHIKEELAAASGQAFLMQAPVVFVVCADPPRSGARYGLRGSTLYCLQDTAAAVQNILLAATSMGLGTCWMGAFDEAKVAKALDCPENLRPVAMVPVGYPNETPTASDKRSLQEVTKHL
jgi:nitroreductase